MKTEKSRGRRPRRKASDSSFFKFLFYAKDISGVTSVRLRSFLNGKVMRIFLRLTKSVSNTSSRFFGVAMLTFSIAIALITLVKYYFNLADAINIPTLITAGGIFLLAIPFLITSQPVGIALQKNAATDFVLFEFFALNRMVKNDSVRTLHPLFGIILGLIPSVCAYFFPLKYIVLIMLGALLFSISMVSTEFPIMLSLVILPYMDIIPYSVELLAIISLVAFVSFARKVLIGKRVYSFEIADIPLILFLVLVIVSSFVQGDADSEREALILGSFILAYIPLSNVIVNRRLAICAANAIIVSTLPVAIGAIADYVIGILRGAHAPADFIFGSSEVLVAFLLVAFFLTGFFILERTHASVKAIYLVILGIYLSAIIATECVFVILILLLSVPAGIVIRSLSLPREALLFIAIIPGAVFFLPDTILERLSNLFFAMPDFLEIKASIMHSFSIFSRHIFFGIHPEEVDSATAILGGNSISWLLSSFGAFAAFAFLLLILVRLRKHTAYSIYRSSSNVTRFVSMGNLSAFGLASLGIIYNVFSDPGVFYLFFASLGISSAALRISKRDHDDRLGYYGDQSSSDSSAIDVVVRY